MGDRFDNVESGDNGGIDVSSLSSNDKLGTSGKEMVGTISSRDKKDEYNSRFYGHG